MRITMNLRSALAAIALVAAFVMGVHFAAGPRSAGGGAVSASPDPPNPGHSWSQIGDLPGTMWHSNNDGTGSGLNADLLDGLSSNQIQDADNYVSSAGNSDTADGKHASELVGTPVTTSATCVTRSDCSCSRTTISHTYGYGSCDATSDTGSCNASGCHYCSPPYMAACCVCAH